MWRELVWIGSESGEQGGKITMYNNDDNNNSNNSSNNLKAVHSFLSNIEIRYKQSYNTRHIASYCSADKRWLDFPAVTKPPLALQLAENYPDLNGIIITERLLYCTGIKCD